MEIILLEKVRNLGNIGTEINVTPGYARNFLIPTGKAVRATKENIEKIEKSRVTLEEKEQATLAKAQERKTAIEALGTVAITAKASDEGKLFGSIGTRDIASAITTNGITIAKSEVLLPQGPMRLVGEYEIILQLHTDVTAAVKVKIAPTK